MDNYPTLPIERGSSLDAQSGVQIVRAEDGSARGRSLWPAAKAVKIAFRHPYLTDGELATLDAFYAAHPDTVFLFSARITQGVPLAVLFAKPPVRTAITPTRWTVAVELTEV